MKPSADAFTPADAAPGAMSSAVVDIGEPAGRNAFGEPVGQGVFGESAGQDVFGESVGQDAFGESAGQDAFGEPAGQSVFGESAGQDAFGESADQDVFGEPAGQDAFGERWPGPIRATRDDPDAAAVGDRFTAFGTSSPDGSVRPAHRPPAERLDAGGSRSTAYRTFDSRALPRRSGAGRIVATVLSMLAVAGAMAGGGHFVWKTELVRPVLVRHQPPMPAPDMEPAPMHTAHTAASMAADAASGAASDTASDPAPRTDERLRLPTPESAQAPPERPGHFVRVSAEAPGREDAVRVRVLPSTGAPTSDRAAGSRTLPVVETAESEPVERAPVPAPAREHRSPEPSPSVFPSGQPGRAGPDDRDHLPAGHLPAFRTAARAAAAGMVEPPVRAAASGRPDPADSPEPGPAPAGAGPRSGSGGGIEIRKRVRPDHVATLIERAYEMFRAGHVEPAAEAYRAVLGHEPRNRDALLGLAAVAAREGRWEEAAGRYGQALASNPADTVAQAALIAIDEQDPVHGERRLKALLRSEPRAAYLHFNLGNVYAAQSRWSEAQRSYLDAWHLDSGNADYAYNLAVSLDHLARRESALGFYREALALARSRPASFETAAAVARIREMEASPGGGVATGRSLAEPAGAAPDGPTAAASGR